MPIGNINGTTQLEFGHGDIMLAAGLLKVEEGEPIGVVVFQNQAPRKIGEIIVFDNPKDVAIEETPARMIFLKIESIDAVIAELERAKMMMQQNTVFPK